MDKAILNSKISICLAALALNLLSSNVFAYGTYGSSLDTQCTSASIPVSKTPPQQSRPYAASGNNCASCHPGYPSTPPNRNNLTAMGRAASPSTAGYPASMNPFCIKTAITAVNIAAPPAGASVNPGGTVVFTGTATDPDGLPVNYSWSFTGGTPDCVSPNSCPSVNLKVPATATGTITGTLTVTDVDTNVAASKPSRSVTIVASAPTPPTAGSDSYSAQIGQTLSVPAAQGVLSNDHTNPPGGTLTAGLVAGKGPAFGTLNLVGDGSFTYTPTATSPKTDSFTYQATDAATSLGTQATVTVTINSAPAPSAPVASPDTYSTRVGQTLTVAKPGVLGNDTGTSATSTAVLSSGPGNAQSFLFNADGSFSYTSKSTPTSGYTDSFSYRAKNGTLTSANPATVTITVTPVGPCGDRDGDGYSWEGVACGPVDCDDNNARITTSCYQTSACINTLLASQLRVDSAAWDGESKITVTGSKAPKGATVNVYDAAAYDASSTRNVSLGSVKVEDSGLWTLEREHLVKSPCRVKAVISQSGGVKLSGERAVTGAPASCGPTSTPAACAGEAETSESSSDRNTRFPSSFPESGKRDD